MATFKACRSSKTALGVWVLGIEEDYQGWGRTAQLSDIPSSPSLI